jgi:hypothetical protein
VWTGKPDEIMIDWGNTPPGSTASIYWPQVLAADVIDLASRLYVSHFLSAADAHTLRCKTVKGATYIPVPSAANQNFAGLLTVDLPLGVKAGQVYSIVVRRLTTSSFRTRGPLSRTGNGAKSAKLNLRQMRVVTGGFRVTIPVNDEAAMLPEDENTLAVMKWRLQEMSPVYRWHPVVKRYVDYLSAKINASGGNAGSIAPSPIGVPVTGKLPCHPVKGREYTGKVAEVMFDCFGDFSGFALSGCCASSCAFQSHEKGIGELALKACRERLTLTVCCEGAEKKIREIRVTS